MNFGFTDDQRFLGEEVHKFLESSYPLRTVREVVDSPTFGGSDATLWNRIVSLGWPGLCLSEAHGGAGLDLETLIVVLEETGRTLLPSPLISTILAARAIERFGTSSQRQSWLPGLADGSRIGTFAMLEAGDSLSPAGVGTTGRVEGNAIVLSGEKRFVPDAVGAGLFVIPVRMVDERAGRSASAGNGDRGDSSLDEIALVFVDREAPGVSVSPLAGMDLTKPMGTVTLSDVRIPLDHLLGETRLGWSAVEWILDLGAALVTAEAVGSVEAALELTTRFAKDRIQFGHPIGHFQGVKHPLAEIYVDLESFRSLAYYAIWAIDHDAPDAKLAVSRAKAYASDAFAQAGILGVQLHGGVGYTWEYDIQLYLKRSKWFRPIFGDADYHYERAARLGGL
ncbi:MAG: acyl-CoA/acyl-ACP dehydrogenase [Deltaproteobacteria bacterium]|nr:acyl-CoA/acyl-ACP dehydrogenase [Deltaproteobacteria bacterium]